MYDYLEVQTLDLINYQYLQWRSIKMLKGAWVNLLSENAVILLFLGFQAL